MKFSTRTRYGIRAILEIALNKDANGIYQKEISKNQDISYKYLDQIITGLKVAGLVTKAGGRRSGYVLTRSAEEITVFDVHNAFEPGICIIDCLASNFSCEREKFCSLRGFWGQLNNQIIDYFKSKTIQDLIEEQIKLDDLAQVEN
ncbi:Rrf2 family transcriptional regulator [Mariniphaga sediminis]|uniref:Rrf2 family transcriptional regulator n=1 Tax=Mariniphaga sediminis TaxID=1628158 RepID=A0A399CZR7_9BACT|nr:Rrf2 family transcriptional regulator [Mariniphaga sediminis]RIH64653.1 Rrf2 family transcriptional regulator [Mariniphaga sediminis]